MSEQRNTLNVRAQFLSTQSRNHRVNNYHVPTNVFLASFCLFLFIYLGLFSSLFAWLIVLLFTHVGSEFAVRLRLFSTPQKSVALTSYLLLSTIGLLISVDNCTNFGMLFGFGGDDLHYFERVVQLIRGETVHEFGVFEWLMALWGWFLHPFHPGNLCVADLLPINWMAGALCIALAGQLAYETTGKHCPTWLLFLAMLGNMRFTDSTVRFYRDGFMLAWLLLFLLAVARQRYSAAWFCLVPVAALRLANAMLGLFYLFLVALKKRFKNRVLYFAVAGMISLAGILFVVSRAELNLIAYMSDLARLKRYVAAFEQLSFTDQLSLRTEALQQSTEHVGEDNLMQQAYLRGGIKGALVRTVYITLFPLTFHSPYEPMFVADSVSIKRVIPGFYFQHLIDWCYILVWVPILPLLAIGIACMARGTNWQTATTLYFVATVLSVALISGQTRHGCAFVILHPAIITAGYYATRANRKLRLARDFGTVLTLLGIIVWNMLRYDVI